MPASFFFESKVKEKYYTIINPTNNMTMSMPHIPPTHSKEIDNNTNLDYQDDNTWIVIIGKLVSVLPLGLTLVVPPNDKIVGGYTFKI